MQLTVNDLTLESLVKNHPNLASLERNFHVVGLDNTNPWKMSVQNLKPNDVLTLSKSGVPIIATPHIGRHWRSNSMYTYLMKWAEKKKINHLAFFILYSDISTPSTLLKNLVNLLICLPGPQPYS